MESDDLPELLRRLEGTPPEERGALLCFVAGQEVTLDDAELNAAVRRAELLLAAGGDPRRPLEVDGRAVVALADDLDTPERRAALHGALGALLPEAGGLHGVEESLGALLDDAELAWRWFALALMADALGDEDAAEGGVDVSRRGWSA